MTLITLLVVSAFTLSSSNLKAVGNMQARDESVAAANQAIELVVSSAFTDAPVAQEVNVDINKDGTTDYTVEIAAAQMHQGDGSAQPGQVRREPQGALRGEQLAYRVGLEATVGDAVSGAAVVVHQGVRVKLSNSQKTAVCATPEVLKWRSK